MPTLDLAPFVEELRADIGRTWPPEYIDVERGAIAKFARSYGETNPLYFDEDYARTTRFGGIIAPPTYISCFGTEAFYGAISGHPELKRKLHGSDVIEFSAPIRPGDRIAITLRLVDVYSKDGRNGTMLFEVFEQQMVNQHGQEVARLQMTTVSL